MRIKRLYPVALVACATVLSACIVEPARPPEPAPRVETPPPAPAQGYAWAKGHYRWEGNQWVWIPGHWVQGY